MIAWAGLSLASLRWVGTAVSPSPEPLDPSVVEPGLIGLAFFLVMGLAVVFLVRSMRNRLNNIDVDRHRRDQEAKARGEQVEREPGES